jgi:hypothetical protein
LDGEKPGIIPYHIYEEGAGSVCGRCNQADKRRKVEIHSGYAGTRDEQALPWLDIQACSHDQIGVRCLLLG